jgi:D-beta-D-heptose 7-phosphate kinase/D-beta-D-heptose 1-phosphate adenosyltransferase
VSASARELELIRGFAGTRLLVIGDLILDRYVWGSSERISPEAPVPVVRVDRESTMLGGAGNVARNLSSLGAQVELVSLTGADEAAAEIRRLCEAWKIETRHVVPDPARPTTEKTRIIARAQQVVRYDREVDEPVADELAERLVEGVRECAARVDGAVLEDYQKGMLGGAVLSEVLAVLAQAGVRVFVDPKGPPWHFHGVELVKPNLREAEVISQIRARGAADLERLGRHVLGLCGADTVAITRGREGMSLFRHGEPTLHVPTAARAVADVAGAGDTAIAALALVRLAGGSWREAARLSNAAAGVVVSVPGTATVTPDELVAALGAAP